jgi:VIT1/CCC1 family predicted Fe2+/Mn2+ transporter
LKLPRSERALAFVGLVEAFFMPNTAQARALSVLAAIESLADTAAAASKVSPAALFRRISSVLTGLPRQNKHCLL